MSPDDRETLETAAALLDGMAFDLRCAHNVDWQAPTWDGEEPARRMHDQAKRTSDALRAMLDDKVPA